MFKVLSSLAICLSLCSFAQEFAVQDRGGTQFINYPEDISSSKGMVDWKWMIPKARVQSAKVISPLYYQSILVLKMDSEKYPNGLQISFPAQAELAKKLSDLFNNSEVLRLTYRGDRALDRQARARDLDLYWIDLKATEKAAYITGFLSDSDIQNNILSR